MKKETKPPPPAVLTTGHFRKGLSFQGYRRHGTRDWLLIHTVHGSGVIAGGADHFISQKGDMILLRPGVVHDYSTAAESERWEILWAHFSPRKEVLPWLDWPEVIPGVRRLFFPPGKSRLAVERGLAEMHRLNRGADEFREALGMNRLERVLLDAQGVNPRRRASRMDARVKEAMDYLCEHSAEPFEAELLARHCGISNSRLSHLFVRHAGQSPRNFQENQRIHRALGLLSHAHQTIAEVAAEVGFDNPFYFTLRFKKWVGVSPRDYRKRLAD